MPAYRMIQLQLLDEQRVVLQRVKQALADADLVPCSACGSFPQVMHCAHVEVWKERRNTRGNETYPVYCAKGYCGYHLPCEPQDADMWRCVQHAPSAQERML